MSKTKDDKSQWHLAVKNSLTSKTKWYYVVLYDFDNIQLTELDTMMIADLMDKYEQSYILRKTMHGYHLIGLTPNSAIRWSSIISVLQDKFPTYHDSQAIRITDKEIGEFIVIQESFKYPFSVNLAKLILPKDRYLEITQEFAGYNRIKELWYVLLYYTTNKKNVKNKEVIKTSG